MASVENNNKNGAIKIAGYLEKKRRKRVVSKWKKYWFVLEGRLLLYYKSHFEVTNLCPCRGSINMGVAISVRPLNSQTHNITGIYMFEIVTHTNKRVLLRTKDKTAQEQWLQALLDALGGQPKLASSRVHHFRYSLDSLTLTTKKPDNNTQFRRQYTLPQNIKNIELHRTKTFLDHFRNITGRHTRSLDAILKKSKETEFMSTIRDDSSESSCSINDKDLEIEPKITKYRSLESITLNKSQEKEKQKSDRSENCVIIENEDYVCVTEISGSTTSSNNTDEENWPAQNVKIEIENELYDENKNNKKIDSVINKNTVYETSTTTDNDINSQQSNINDILNDDDNDIYAVCSKESRLNSKNSSELDIAKNIENKTDENNDEYYSSTYDGIKKDFNSNMENVYCDIDNKNMKPGLSSRSQNADDENVSTEKKKKMFQIKFKFTKQDTKNKVSKSVPKNKKIAVRKESFIDKFFKPNKKKANNASDKDNNDYDIESINSNENDKDKDTLSIKTPVPADHKRICGGFEVLSASAMQELNEKLNLERKKILSRCYSDENDGIYEAIDTGQGDKPEEIPGLPPRKGPRHRSRSPWHDVPTNNTPYSKRPNHCESIISPHDYNNSESLSIPLQQLSQPEISSNDIVHLYSQIHKRSDKKEESKNPNTIDSSELTVKQLIHKFDETSTNSSPNNKGQTVLKQTIEEDVILRKEKCDNLLTVNDIENDGRHSEELNLLLNELSKITTAPLVQPRVINSLIQVKQNIENKNAQNYHSCIPPISDEEWLALGPIRRRRYSEPDYDVPRSHRSLDFVPPLPPKTNTVSETLITTNFFDQPPCNNSTPIICDSIEPPSIAWSRSITPDSLEPNDNHHSIRKYDELDRSMGNETISKNSPLISIKENTLGFIEKDKNDTINEKFFDSLENTTSF